MHGCVAITVIFFQFCEQVKVQVLNPIEHNLEVRPVAIFVIFDLQITFHM
jgi:hypothetical protein